MEATHNMDPSLNCLLHILMSMGHMLRVKWTQGTLENTLGKGLYLNPIPVQNGLKISLGCLEIMGQVTKIYSSLSMPVLL